MKEIDKLKEKIISLKQINEQLESELRKKELFIMDTYPTINNFEVSQGWHGSGTSTYKVFVDVFACDLHKLIRYFTHKSLRDDKWRMISSELKENIKRKIEQGE